MDFAFANLDLLNQIALDMLATHLNKKMKLLNNILCQHLLNNNKSKNQFKINWRQLLMLKPNLEFDLKIEFLTRPQVKRFQIHQVFLLVNR